MSDPPTDLNEESARAMAEGSAHYVQAVSELADTRIINADRDIVSSSGIKLVARGTRIDASLRERLAGHRLSGATLEKSLSVAGGVKSESLAIEMARLIESDPWFGRLAARSGDPAAMRHGASRLHLAREILFRLTVARDQRPALFRHSLGVVIISHYIALRSRLKQADIDVVLIAALCHDLGELYTDPAILEPGHRFTEEERRFNYVHPITGWLLVRDIAELDPEVAKAILQHQERLDGSGYPYGNTESAIGLAGRILAAADVSESIMTRFHDHGRLSALLRLNSKRYDRNVVDLLHQALAEPAAETPAPARFEREALAKRLAGFASVLDGWARLRADAAIAQSPPGAFLSERMLNLRTIMLQFGFDGDSLDTPLQLAEEDATIASELIAVVDELRFQLADLGREFDRRSAGWLTDLEPLAAVSLLDWRRELKVWSDEASEQ